MITGEFEIRVTMKEVWGSMMYYAFSPEYHFNEFAHDLYSLISHCAGVYALLHSMHNSNDPIMQAFAAVDAKRWRK